MRSKRLLTMLAAFGAAFAGSAAAAQAAGMSAADLSAVGGALRAYTPALAMLIFCAVCPVVMLALTRPLSRLEAMRGSKAMVRAFVVLFALNGVICLIMAMTSDGESWSHMMHINAESSEPTQFEAFFKNVRTAARGSYSELTDRNSPMSILIWRIIGKCFPLRYIENNTPDYYLLMIKNKVCMMIYLIIVLCMCMLSYLISQKKIRENGLIAGNELILFMLFFSFPVMYTIELGSLTGVSFVFTLFFILYREHEKPWLRILSEILLALAAAISVVPIVFALVLIVGEKKNPLRLIRTALISVGLFALPAVLTGVHGMLDFASGFFSFPATGVAPGNLSVMGLLYRLGVSGKPALLTIFAATELLALAAFFFTRRPWIKALACAFIVMNIPSYTTAETSVFLLIPLILLLSRKRHDMFDWWGLLLMFCCVAPIPEWYFYNPEKMAQIFSAADMEFVFGANCLAIPVTLAAILALLVAGMFLQKKYEEVEA